MITLEQKKLVQTSFEKVLPVVKPTIELFYQRLFELDATLQPLFNTSLPEQERKLVDMLCIAVYGLDHFNRLVPALRLLGKRHIEYGVKSEYYEIVGAALLWALKQQLGEEQFTPAVQAAWQTMYDLMSEVMTTSRTS